MRPHGLLLAVLLAELLVIGGGAWAGEDMDEQHSPSPPFRVSGTVISLPTKIALVVVLDAQGKSTSEFKLHEGDTVEGYRIANIHHDQVFFERNGQTFQIRVGHERHAAPPQIAPVIPYQRKKERPATFVDPPDNIEEVRKQTETFMQQLKEHPEFQKGLEELKRRGGQRLEDPQATP
jgi:type II secretory pathway component PulC